MKNQDKKLALLGNASIPTALLAMGVPTMIGMLVNAFYNLVDAYFVGESTTPPIGKGDLIVIGSGSGTTASLVENAKKAKAIGTSIATLTIFPDAAIGKMADVVIAIPGATPKKTEGTKDSAISAQPMGSLFEQLSWLVYDSVILSLMEITGETNDTMYQRHANLE